MKAKRHFVYATLCCLLLMFKLNAQKFKPCDFDISIEPVLEYDEAEDMVIYSFNLIGDPDIIKQITALQLNVNATDTGNPKSTWATYGQGFMSSSAGDGESTNITIYGVNENIEDTNNDMIFSLKSGIVLILGGLVVQNDNVVAHDNGGVVVDSEVLGLSRPEAGDCERKSMTINHALIVIDDEVCSLDLGTTASFTVGDCDDRIDAALNPLDLERESENSRNRELVVVNEFKLYPNPILNVLNVELNPRMDNQSMIIMDSKGAVLMNILVQENETVKSIDLSALSSGMYFVQLKSTNGLVSKKLLKQ